MHLALLWSRPLGTHLPPHLGLPAIATRVHATSKMDTVHQLPFQLPTRGSWGIRDAQIKAGEWMCREGAGKEDNTSGACNDLCVHPHLPSHTIPGPVARHGAFSGVGKFVPGTLSQ